ncbi:MULTISPECIES: heavy metal-responsive transcriptional regulator [Streptomyces]|uniref:heavy metal-responsive transcriptional regulator n=1 Tax=Streptomyces TaxID=1883 RepID=UPI00206D3C11|nr:MULTISPECIES: heavy metal-responsive transcriptional regulator [Streptomyces]UPT43235.1 heavy metal-responsive transcriptional regulator [Streptomyces sp. WAC00303]WIY77431.1 heavy metal-responsive transcriptional regulator [Streptomyces anulatus]
MAMQGLTIGQVAQAAGLTRKAVRVYEDKGLLPRAERTPAGYRLYTPDDVELLAFIRQARTLGLHLDDVREVLDIHRGGTPPCDAVRSLLDARIAEVDAAVKDLLALRQTLTETRQAADDRPCGEPSTVCSIIQDA